MARRCCWPTATSASAVTRRGSCGGLANCCDSGGRCVAEFDSAIDGIALGMGPAGIVAHDRPVVPVGIGRHRLRGAAGRRRRPCGRGDPPDRPPRRGQPGGDMKTATLRGTAVTARVGLALGVAVAVCFVTGLISHFIQHPQPWFFWPTRPVWLYRVTQGLHVISRHRRHSADHRQAVVGVAEAVRASDHRWSGPADRAVVDPGAGRRRCCFSCHRAAEHRAVVCVQVLLHHQPLRDGLRRGGRGARAHRRQAAGHPSRAGRARRRHACHWSGRRGARCCAGRGWRWRSRRSSPRGRRFRCCARCRCSRRVRAKGRKGFRSTGRRSRRACCAARGHPTTG